MRGTANISYVTVGFPTNQDDDRVPPDDQLNHYKTIH